MDIITVLLAIAIIAAVGKMGIDFASYIFALFLDHQFLIGGILCFVAGYFALARFKPHPMERIFLYYKVDLINYEQFSNLFSKATYDFRDGLPWFHSSIGMALRLNALKERIEKEAQTINKAKEYVITKETSK